jgi:hypothetical protein
MQLANRQRHPRSRPAPASEQVKRFDQPPNWGRIKHGSFAMLRNNPSYGGYCGMRLRTDSSTSSASLAEYLRRCGCIVAVIDRLIIDATAKPESFAAPHADVELEGYLKVWEAMHPEALLERLTPLGRR